VEQIENSKQNREVKHNVEKIATTIRFDRHVLETAKRMARATFRSMAGYISDAIMEKSKRDNRKAAEYVSGVGEKDND
jgi:predicted transcriptional regulator